MLDNTEMQKKSLWISGWSSGKTLSVCEMQRVLQDGYDESHSQQAKDTTRRGKSHQNEILLNYEDLALQIDREAEERFRDDRILEDAREAVQYLPQRY